MQIYLGGYSRNNSTALAENIKLTISAHIAQGNVCRVFFILQEP